MTAPRDPHIDSAWLLVSRLERMSADSYWAHQASGLRGALLRLLLPPGSQAEAPSLAAVLKPEDGERLEQLVEQGYRILERAAKEIC